LILAVVEIVWLIVQIYWVGLDVWQGVIGGIALVTIFLLYRPSVKAYCGK
jgi:hypothetical protein